MTDRFELLSQLGKGGMGVVWKARDRETGEFVAAKLLHAHLADDPDLVARFEREVELARRVVSRHTVQVLGYGRIGGLPYLAMELVDGVSLRQHIRENGPLAWEEVRGIALQLLSGLQTAHAVGVLHRDLKPSNIIITPSGTAKIVDFGVARANDMTRLTGTAAYLGTPAYCAPEGPKDARSELYSLGCVLYECLVGAAPFDGDSLTEIALKHAREPVDWTRIPPAAASVLGRLLAKEPGERPSRADEPELLASLSRSEMAPSSVPLPVASVTAGGESIQAVDLGDGPHTVVPDGDGNASRGPVTFLAMMFVIGVIYGIVLFTAR
jgi:serine/threonine-protein kinase